MTLKMIWAVAWLTIAALITTPAFYVYGMMNDPVVEDSISSDADSWGIPLFGGVTFGVVLAVVVYGLTSFFTQGYAQPGLFAWRGDRLARSVLFTLLAVLVIVPPILAFTYDFLNAPPPYEYDAVPLLILGVLWIAMLRAAAITMGEGKESIPDVGKQQ